MVEERRIKELAEKQLEKEGARFDELMDMSERWHNTGKLRAFIVAKVASIERKWRK